MPKKPPPPDPASEAFSRVLEDLHLDRNAEQGSGRPGTLRAVGWTVILALLIGTAWIALALALD